MSSDPDTWGGLPDVKIDNAAADSLIAGCKHAATTIRQQCSHRRSLTTTAMQDFNGLFSRIFHRNQGIANEDGENIATALDDVARQVKYLKDLVPGENKRRSDARAWKKRHDEDKAHITFSDLGGDEDPPEGPHPPPPPKQYSAKAKDRENPMPGKGGGGGGSTSSARPSSLRDFAKGSTGYITDLKGKPSKLSGLESDFNAGFDWGVDGTTSVDGSAVYSAFSTYNQLNQQDKTWVNAVAGAFEQAGSSGSMVTVSNRALSESVRAAGVSVNRYDIPPTSPARLGVAPTTGYSDDPVNASTGNFVEPETDLSFAGGCAALVLSRMYNSFNRRDGAFGPGWSSWTEVELTFTDDAAYFTQPDGRVVEFPRLGTGWGRALGVALWLHRDDAADELRITDNDGGTWRFSATGTPLSVDRGEGTMVSFRHHDGRLVGLDHERGRHIALEWHGDRVVAALASDGRHVTYSYDAGRLIATASQSAAGEPGTGEAATRSYRWSADGYLTAVVDADGVVEVHNSYDSQGRVTTQRSPYGRVSRYSYLPGNVTEVADLDGTRANTWIHDGRGRLVGIVDSFDQRQSTSYDAQGNPVMVVGRDGRATVREYDERGHVTREVSPSGAEIRYAYDDRGRILSVTTGDDAVTAYGYDGDQRNPSVMTDPEGGVTRFTWRDGLLARMVDPTGVALQFDYNEYGDLTATTNAAGNSARLEYDASGRVTAAITPSGSRTTFVHGPYGIAERHDPDGAVWGFEYSTGGRLAATIDPTGARTEVEYGDDGEEARTIDPLGRTVQRRLDDLGNLAAVELPDGSTWRFSHDSLSRLARTTSPDGDSWTWRYDKGGDPAGVVDPLGHEVAVSTDPSGNVVSRDATGAVTHRFDELGRPVAAGQLDESAAITTYDRCGRPVEILDPEGSLTLIERDAAGRPVAVTSPVGDVTRIEYDACGRRSATTDALGNRTTIDYDADSRPVRVTRPTGEVGWTSYDVCGRVESAFTPGVGTSAYRYDPAGRVIEAKGPSSGRRRFRYDPAGQLTAVVNGNGGITRYGYDENGRNTTITDPLGNVTRREFDAENRCIAETDPLGRTTRAGYDAIGSQIWQTEPGGRRTEWAYDASGRVTSIAVNGREVSRIDRDLRNRRVRIIDRTRSDRVTTHQLEWNRRDQLIRQERDGNVINWSYDASGRRTSMTTPDGTTTTYGYDAANRLAIVEHPLLGRVNFTHDGSGRLASVSTGELSQSWTYTAGFVSTHKLTDADGTMRTTIHHDDDGRIDQIDKSTDDGAVRSTTRFDYDEACQLISARLDDGLGASVSRWRYDLAGRLIAETHDGRTRDYVYDEAAQLLSSTGPDGTDRHSYDGAGRRVRSSFGDGRTRDYSWSPTGFLSSVTDRAGDRVRTTRMHVDSTGQLASVASRSGAADSVELSTYWDSADPYAPDLVQAGNASVLTTAGVTGIGDQWAATGWRTDRATSTDPWGFGAATDLPGMPGDVSIGAAGELSIAGLEWLHARAYDPGTRGFLSVDQLEPVLGAGWAGNPYAYAGNDPLHALDPTGLKPVTQQELENARKPWYEKAWDASTHWVKNNWEYLAGGAMVIAGGVLTATGVGGPAGMMLISAGADTIIQKATTGHVNWGEVAVSGALGGVGGLGVAAKVGATGLKAAAITGAVSGGVSGAGMGAYRYSTGPGPHSVGGFLTATGTGAVEGAVLGGAGGAAGHGIVNGAKALRGVKPKPSVIDPDTAKLTNHVARARGDFDNSAIPMSPKEAINLRNPRLKDATRGTLIDRQSKEYIDADPDLQHLYTTPAGYYGPDVMDFNTGRWWDITTQAKWDMHQTKYDHMGPGIGIFTD